ncbi:MAG: chromosomal replication initiator protein DnaA [Bacilli bacterium]|jgi:chromosomal replication initiator protein|nr:chromosomal replication initiator protein DnaA [Bacilli bacterium]
MNDNINLLWSNTLIIIREEINDDLIYNEFFADSYIDSINSNIVNIIVDDIIAKQYMEAHLPFIETSLNKVSETNFKVIFTTTAELASKVISESPINQITTNLKTNFSFDLFVSGPSNNQAYKAAISVANTPGQLYNPLFIYGASGLGKTHLIHSIGNSILKNKPNMRVLYVTSEEFVTDYVAFSQNPNTNNTDSFNNKYRNLDVLLIDDIQFLKEKTKSNEMFFNIYNNLFNHNKQVVITADVNPSKLNGLEDRLISRFNQGLSISISPPHFETSIKILQNKLSYFDATGTVFSDEALKFIATHFSKDVRELEGALRRVLFYLIDLDNPEIINLEIVSEAFKDYQLDNINSCVTSENILDCVCNYYNLSKAQIISKNRQKNISIPRHIAIYLERTLLETPFEKIGKLYGNRDHSTIMSSYHKIKIKLDEKNIEFAQVINEITNMLKKT